MSGGPVANAVVVFSPKEKQPVATGRTDDTGHYVVTTYDDGDGAAAGRYAVLVIKQSGGGSGGGASIGGHNPDNPNAPFASPSHAVGRRGKTVSRSTSTLPEKYSNADQSDLKATVKEGENELNFELKP